MTFIFSKLVWALLQPGNLLLLCLLAGVFMLLRGRRRGERLVVLSAIGCSDGPKNCFPGHPQGQARVYRPLNALYAENTIHATNTVTPVQ